MALDLLQKMEEDGDEDDFMMWHIIQSQQKANKKRHKPYYGRGNAVSGQRRAYQPYPPSTVFERNYTRPRVWNNFVRLLDVPDFLALCDLIEWKWMLPRNGGLNIRPRKHPLRALMFSVMGILSTGVSDVTMEGVSGVSAGLIGAEFENILILLNDALDGLFLLDDEDKRRVRGSCKSNPNILYFVDGCDIAVAELKEAWLWKTHKKNVKGQKAMRAQILVDAQLRNVCEYREYRF